MDVDREYGFPAGGIECGDERLAGVAPGGVEGVDAAGVEFEFGAGEDLVFVGGRARVWVAESEKGRLVEVGNADVAAGFAAVLAVDRRDLGESVGDT